MIIVEATANNGITVDSVAIWPSARVSKWRRCSAIGDSTSGKPLT
jgi:hypothetical protein